MCSARAIYRGVSFATYPSEGARYRTTTVRARSQHARCTVVGAENTDALLTLQLRCNKENGLECYVVNYFAAKGIAISFCPLQPAMR